jgi:hypothetical protein
MELFVMHTFMQQRIYKSMIYYTHKLPGSTREGSPPSPLHINHEPDPDKVTKPTMD